MKDVKRIAVCMAGQARFINECKEFHKDFYENDGIQVDYFVHSWTNGEYSRKTLKDYTKSIESKFLNSRRCRPIDEIKKEFELAYQPKKIIVEDQHTNVDLMEFIDTLNYLYEKTKCFHNLNDTAQTIKFESIFQHYKDLKTKNNNQPTQLPNSNILHMGQIYSVSKAFELKNKYEKENNFEYDLAFRCRSDNMPKPINKKSKLHLNRLLNYKGPINTHTGNNRPLLATTHFSYHDGVFFTGDKIFGGKSKDMSVFEKLFDFRFNQVVEHLFKINHWAFAPETSIGSLFSRAGGEVNTNKDFLNLKSNFSYRDYMLRLKDQSYDSLRNASLALENADVDTMEAYIKSSNCSASI